MTPSERQRLSDVHDGLELAKLYMEDPHGHAILDQQLTALSRLLLDANRAHGGEPARRRKR